MNRRASWKGHLKFADFSCEIGLYAALTASEKISFNIVNRKTGHRVERQYVDRSRDTSSTMAITSSSRETRLRS